MPTDIVLSTMNTRFGHCSFGLRYLRANLGPNRDRSKILEFTIQHRPVDVVEELLAENPRIIALGVYIWNAAPMAEVVFLLKKVRAEIVVILGGPEVSHETEQQPMCAAADYVVCGEGDLVFASLCEQILSGNSPSQRFWEGGLPPLSELVLPYGEYTDQDIAHRTIYVEASRGCPFRCEFCLSALDKSVRKFPLEKLLAALTELWNRGLSEFKFVDRTFNLDISTSRAILGFFLDHQRPGLFVHFEMIPDRLPEELRELICQFPKAMLQFEIGIQTFDPDVSANISRRQKIDVAEDNLRFLNHNTGVHIHTDLIFGLPGQSLSVMAQDFDRLWKLGPHEVQVGILKRLRGAPIARHDGDKRMVYSPVPPYDVLSTGEVDFPTMQHLKRFSQLWDRVGNSGYFTETVLLMLGDNSPFYRFSDFTQQVYTRHRRSHGIALVVLAEELFVYLTTALDHPPTEVAQRLASDFLRTRQKSFPDTVSAHLPTPYRVPRNEPAPISRQDRHR